MAVSSINNNSGAGGTGTGNSAADLSNQFMTLLVAQMKTGIPPIRWITTSLPRSWRSSTWLLGLRSSTARWRGSGDDDPARQYERLRRVGRSVLIEGEAKVSFGEPGIGIMQEGVEIGQFGRLPLRADGRCRNGHRHAARRRQGVYRRAEEREAGDEYLQPRRHGKLQAGAGTAA